MHQYVFLVFMGWATLAFIFIYLKMPETRNQPIEQIQRMLRDRSQLFSFQIVKRAEPADGNGVQNEIDRPCNAKRLLIVEEKRLPDNIVIRK